MNTKPCEGTDARDSGRHAGTKSKLLLLTLSAFLCGCVNMHVHFPEAADKPAGPAQTPGGPAK
ncbi:MAG: hypothetical protein R3E35_15585 [Rhodocyclaceae bacterium]|jgi:hypothetical protein